MLAIRPVWTRRATERLSLDGEHRRVCCRRGAPRHGGVVLFLTGGSGGRAERARSAALVAPGTFAQEARGCASRRASDAAFLWSRSLPGVVRASSSREARGQDGGRGVRNWSRGNEKASRPMTGRSRRRGAMKRRKVTADDAVTRLARRVFVWQNEEEKNEQRTANRWCSGHPFGSWRWRWRRALHGSWARSLTVSSFACEGVRGRSLTELVSAPAISRRMTRSSRQRRHLPRRPAGRRRKKEEPPRVEASGMRRTLGAGVTGCRRSRRSKSIVTGRALLRSMAPALRADFRRSRVGSGPTRRARQADARDHAGMRSAPTAEGTALGKEKRRNEERVSYLS